MIAVVAEKPSVGMDIARVLGCRERGDGFVQGAGYIVTWAIGHLVSQCEPDEIDEKYKRWNMKDLPILPESIPCKVLPKTRKQYGVVKKIINSADTEKIICATDAGREGELIFRLIYTQAKCRKPVERLWISSMTDAAIREGFAQLKPESEYDGLYRSAQSRAEADWLVGMNASRAFSIRYSAHLSIGRVQTPTLALLVRRWHEIENFKPEEYYTLTASFGDWQGVWFDPKREDEKTASRIASREEAQRLADKVKEGRGRITSVTKEDKKELPPQLYDLTSLQRDANRRWGFTADKTLKITQDLYEKWKAVTYPRTDSRYLPLDMLPRIRTTLEKLPEEYRKLNEGIAWQKDGKLPFSKRVFDNSKVSDHHAIVPTAQTAPVEKLPEDAKKIFDMIARRTAAVFYPAYEYEAVKVLTRCRDEMFKTTGRNVTREGWKAVYAGTEKEEESGAKRKKAEEPEEKPLPPLKEGDEYSLQSTAIKKETTKPPAPQTDASLLYAMENAGRDLDDEALREQMKGSGLGTPATRAAMIERLIKVGYAQRRGKAIQPTEKGIQLIELVPQELSSPEMTGKWELALHEIAENRRECAPFMDSIRRYSVFLVEFARDRAPEKQIAEEKKNAGKKRAASAGPIADVACPLCGKGVAENSRAFYCLGWKEGCPFTLWKDCLTKGGGPLLNERIVTALLKNGSVAGSTGRIELTKEAVSFIPKDGGGPGIRREIKKG